MSHDHWHGGSARSVGHSWTEIAASHILGGAGHHDRRHHGAHGTAGATTGRSWATTRRNTPALPTGFVRSPSVRPPEHRAL